MSYLDNIRTFVRVYELGSMSAAGRDLRISPAVTSARISQLEAHLSVRLFQRTTNQDEKSELLVFVTPKIIKDNVSVNF